MNFLKNVYKKVIDDVKVQTSGTRQGCLLLAGSCNHVDKARKGNKRHMD